MPVVTPVGTRDAGLGRFAGAERSIVGDAARNMDCMVCFSVFKLVFA